MDFEVEGPKVGFDSVGPFTQWVIRVDGFRVPYITGRVIDGMLHLCLDNRFGCEIPEQYATSVMWFIANAMAVSAGYTSFGENSKPSNPFNTRFSGLEMCPEPEVSEEAPAS
jgi:hypothetical protein